MVVFSAGVVFSVGCFFYVGGFCIIFFQLFMLIRPGIITGLSPNVAVSIVRLSKWPMNTFSMISGEPARLRTPIPLPSDLAEQLGQCRKFYNESFLPLDLPMVKTRISLEGATLLSSVHVYIYPSIFSEQGLWWECRIIHWRGQGDTIKGKVNNHMQG